MLLRVLREARGRGHFVPDDLVILNAFVLGAPFTDDEFRRELASRSGYEDFLGRRDKLLEALDRLAIRHFVHYCEWSGFLVTAGGTIHVDGYGVLSPQAAAHLARPCVECSNLFVVGDLTSVDGHGLVCSRCLNRHYRYCAQHNRVHRLNELCPAAAQAEEQRRLRTQREEAERGRLAAVEDAYAHPNPNPFVETNVTLPTEIPVSLRSDRQRCVLNYSANVLDVLRGFRGAENERLPEEPLWLGVELEVQPRVGAHHRYVAMTYETVKSFAVMKNDGSLRDGGFEIVTVPGTLAWHLSGVWDDFFKRAAPNLHAWDTETCGLHVHINRHAMSAFTIGKLLTFVHDQRNADLLSRVAGRRIGGSYYSTVNGLRVRDGRYRGRSFEWSHHWALGFSTKNHGSTLELRIFRGNCGRNGLFRSLEFTQMICEFAATSSPKEMTAEAFSAWFQQPWIYPRYPHFKRWARKNDVLRLRSKLREEIEPEKLDA